jgi:heme-degrading monooxygenase HmoA
MSIAKTPPAPYYAVIFSSLRAEGDNGYGAVAQHMEKLAQQQPGYLGHESARDCLGITVYYWADLDSIKKWKANEEHFIAQQGGRKTWYSAYKVRVCKVERDYDFGG